MWTHTDKSLHEHAPGTQRLAEPGPGMAVMTAELSFAAGLLSEQTCLQLLSFTQKRLQLLEMGPISAWCFGLCHPARADFAGDARVFPVLLHYEFLF